jgi:hypothetical protein
MKQIENTRFLGFAVVLTLFFVSCDTKNGLPDNELSGQSVPVRIRSFAVAEGGSESFTRTSLQGKQETVLMPIGDGMLMEMSVKEEESPLRKTELATGAYFRVIAVKAGTTEYHSHGDFVYENPITLLTDFHVKIGDEYDYICFSYNETTNTLPPATGYSEGVALPISLNMSTTKDPLWCKITGLGQVSSSGVELDITMKHLLAKVKVKVDCGYNGWKITGVAANKVAVVTVNPALSCAIDWKTGVISGTDMDQGLSYTISDATRTDQISGEVTIIPKASNAVIKFKASAVSRNGLGTAVPISETTATLDRALEGGVSYTITVRLRTPIWARSNIYWDGAAKRMTFVPAGTDKSKEGYQGVYFKWGSLVGIGPTGFGSATTVYLPDVADDDGDPDTKWRTPMTPNAAGYGSWGEYNNGNIGIATGVPYVDPVNFPGNSVTGRDNTYLLDLVAADAATMYANFRGDICQYLGTLYDDLKGYRMPTSLEFGHDDTDQWTGRTDSWVKATSFSYKSYSSVAADGTTNMIGAATPPNESFAQNTAMDVILPASGYMSTDGGLYGYTSAGLYGFYYSSSVEGALGQYCMTFDYGNHKVIVPYNGGSRSYGGSIRCVKN